MPKIIKTTVYLFDELPPGIQEKILQRYGDCNVPFQWWDFMYEDAKSAGLEIKDFDIDGGYCNGVFTMDAKEVAESIIENHGEQCDTYATAAKFLSDFAAFGKRKDRAKEGNEYDFDLEADELEDEFLKSLCRNYLKMLRDEYDYQTSDEAVMAAIRANEWTFTDDGKMMNA